MNPGNDEAIKAGCTCAVMDNCHGEGIPTRIGKKTEVCFWISADCPIHGKVKPSGKNTII